MAKIIYLTLSLIFAIFQVGRCTYDCIKHCACEMKDDILTADCSGLNFTDVPEPEPEYQRQVDVLRLQYNKITILRTGDFLLFPSLTELYLQGNRMSNIENGAFDGLLRNMYGVIEQAIGLFMNVNIAALRGMGWENVDITRQGLQKLDLSSNMIYTIPSKAVEVFSESLTWLSLAMNGLRNLPYELKNMTKLEFLDISHNQFIVGLAPGIFPSSLVNLDVGYTGVKFFPKSAFENLNGLLTLNISDNMASSSLKFEDGVFDGLISLEYIDLSRSFCKKMSPNSFSKLANLKTLLMNNCWLSQPPIFARRTIRGLVSPESGLAGSDSSNRNTSPPTSKPQTTLDVTTGMSTPDGTGIWYNPKLAVVDLSNNRRMLIKPGVTRLPPTLTDLRLSSTTIQIIDGDLFNETIWMQKLDLSRARIRSIANEAFSNLRNVTKIELSGNPLEVAPRLPASLLSLDLSGTKITNLTKSMLVDLSKVVDANFNYGEIAWIEDFAFENMSSMQKLDLSENKIDRLQQNALVIGRRSSNTKRATRKRNILVELNLAANILRSIESGAFATLEKLQTLDLQGNFLEVIESGLFAGLQNLVTLNLNGNSIVDVTPNALDDLASVEVLHLEDNDLEIIFPGLFEKMQGLKQLHLARNKLALIHEIDSPRLTSVDVSSNNLTAFPPIGGVSLTEIKATNNPMETFTSGALLKAVSLQTLDISHCHFASMNYSELISCPILKSLDLNNNYITNFVNVKMASLETFVLEENSIQHIEKSLKDVCPKIANLNLDYNNISTLNSSVFSGASSLSRLSLSGNNFLCDCSLLPFVEWMNKHERILVQPQSYRCMKPLKDLGKSVLDTVSGLNCQLPPTEPKKARMYIIVGLAVVLLALLLVFLILYVRRRAARQAMREDMMRSENAEPMLNERVDVNERTRDTCCSSFSCCVPTRDLTHGRQRILSDDRRDLVDTTPATSPKQINAPESV